MFKITARLDVHLDPNDILNEFGLEPGGFVQRTVDQLVIDFCDPYVPASPRESLKTSAGVATEIGSGLVVYDTPYAHYMYMGIVYGPNFLVDINGKLEWRSYKDRTKKPTNRKLTYDQSRSPLAGPFWLERMKADRMTELLDVVRKAAVQRGK